MVPLTAKNFDRLAKAMMQRHKVGYSRAQALLGTLKLHLVCNESIRNSAALQAAVLTAINTGKRAFRGGVTIDMPANVGLRLPWPRQTTLNRAAMRLGARFGGNTRRRDASLLFFGSATAEKEGLRVVCDSWRGGVLPSSMAEPILGGPDLALGGVFAGGFAVARSFLSAAQITNREITAPTGFSLWRPDLPWLSWDASGPLVDQLPLKLWLLGLGHLGQAYAWLLSLLPRQREKPMTVYLQDFDIVEEANWSAGLLCEPRHVGELKTRVCADWLECRGFQTRLIERRFGRNTVRDSEEPRVAFCGFDNAEARTFLEDAGFDLVIDCGLGATIERFDRIVLRTFPDASVTAREIWKGAAVESTNVDLRLVEDLENDCGIVARDIAAKAISSAFTGACASALVFGEILRALHGGSRCEFLKLHLRDLETPETPFREERYQLRIARNGILPIAA